MAENRIISSVGEDVIKMQNSSIFVLGDLILDSYISGKVSRISPEAPVPVVLEDKSWDVLGGAANVAANIADFGGSVFLAGRIGNDDVGLKLLKLCGSRKIDCRAVVKSDKCPTIKKLRVMAGYQQVVRIDSESVTNLESDHEAAILAAFEIFAKESGPKSFVISDYAKGVCSQSMLLKIIALSEKHKIPVVTDPKNVDLKRYAGSTIIKPNLTDGRALFKHLHPDKALSDANWSLV